MNEIYLGAFTLQDSRMQPVLDEAVILPEQAAEFLQAVTAKIAGGVAVGTGFTSYTELAAKLGLRQRHRLFLLSPSAKVRRLVPAE
jgi:tRNA threonylcarbamoyladenosine biosynthesis protein TsaB